MYGAGEGHGPIWDTSLHPGAMMNFDKTNRICSTPHPGRDKSRSLDKSGTYAFAFASLGRGIHLTRPECSIP